MELSSSKLDKEGRSRQKGCKTRPQLFRWIYTLEPWQQLEKDTLDHGGCFKVIMVNEGLFFSYIWGGKNKELLFMLS